ncbi:nucleotidyltransferase domain-containing protein [Myroides sp. LJL115]
MAKVENYLNDLDTGIKTQDWELIIKIFDTSPSVEKVVLYGSRAKGNYKEYSDIDLTLIGKLNLMELQSIENQLYELNLPFIFDLSQYHVIKNVDLLDHIHRVGVVIFDRN